MPTLASAENPARVAPGDLIAGKYRVERVLGQGGMGVVVAARHEELGQRVAIKLLRPDIADTEGALDRFLREARAAARIESDHVARVFDVGKQDDGRAYMVLEFLEGADLGKVLASREALPVDEAVDLVLEALDAVAHAHVMGIVHRDLKPSNLFLVTRSDGSQRLKVLDFGISKASGFDASSSEASLTASQSMLGSPAYMSPEQVRNAKGVDVRSDIWSLGVILYELLTGRTPFVGDTLGDTLARIIEGTYLPPRVLRPEVPIALSRVIERCLQRDKEKRFANVAELSDALAPLGSPRAPELSARVARVLGVTLTPGVRREIVSIPDGGAVSEDAETLAAGQSGSAQQTASAWTGAVAARRPSRKAWWALGGLGVAGAAIGGMLVLRAPSPVSANVPAAPVTAEPPVTPLATPPATPPVMPTIAPGATLPPEPAKTIDPAPSLSTAPAATPAKARVAAPRTAPATRTAITSTPPKGLLDGRD
jgi:serine/threonine-protein kinase